MQDLSFSEIYNNFGISTGLTNFQLTIASLPTVYNSASDPVSPQSLTAGYITSDLFSSNYKTGVSGWKLSYQGDFEGNNGYFRGDITGATGIFTGGLAIGTSPNWFKVDNTGNIWSGADTLALAQTDKFAVLNTGILYCKSAFINGAVIDGTSLIVGTAASLVETGTLANFPSDANLVGYWAFDEGIGAIAYDNSGNGRNCALQATPSWATGIVGKSIDLDGATQYGIIDDNDVFSFGNGTTDLPFSFFAWVYMDDATNFRILEKYVYSNGDTGEYVFECSGIDKVFVYLIDESVKKYIGRYYTVALTTYQGQWIQLGFTYNGSGLSSGIKIYLNGVRVDDGNNESGGYVAMENTTKPIWIGRKTNTYANGKIDEARFYNSELTAAQVYALYKYPSGNPAVAYSGAQIIDGTVVAAKIITTNLAAIKADLGSITAGNITLDTSGFIRGGQTAFDTGDNGFWFGYDSGTWKFSMAATATQRWTMDNSGINISAKINKLAGDILYQSADTGRNSQNANYYKLKEIQIFQSGSYRIKFDFYTGSDYGTGYAQIFKNGVAVGTERSEAYIMGNNWDNYSEDIAGFVSGDLIQIYAKVNRSGGSTCQANVQNFRLYVSQRDHSVVNTD